MQSNAKHKFECFRRQGARGIMNQDRLNGMLKNEGDEYGIR
jgi:hypothetical protein